jgi:hypothetical protein
MRRQVLAAFALAAVAMSAGGGIGVIGARLSGPPAAHATVSPSTCAEDEPCWDWRTMGDHARGVCVDDVDVLEHADPAAPYDLTRRTFTPGGRGCEALSDDARPVCWVEPSSTVEGFEVIWYPHLNDVELGNPGFEVPCP